MTRVLTLLLAIAPLAPSVWGATNDPLPRRGYLGASLSAEAPEEGIRVLDVFPGTPAEAAGLKSDDVLLRLNGEAIAGPSRMPDTLRTIGATHEGEVLSTTVSRAGQEIPLEIRMASLPMESSADFETRYDSVVVGTWRQRVILTLPRGDGPHPGIFYLQGLSCGSIESPLQPDDVVRHATSEWTRAGFAVLRIEKSGVGDSSGPPCAEIGFQEELRGYAAGLQWLTERSGIDPTQVFLFGHSMGGVFAPLVAQEVPVRGIIVFGTIAAPLAQYFMENEERQMRMLNRDQEHLAREMEHVDEFIRAFFGERLTPAQLEERAPYMHEFLQFRGGDATHLYGRHYRFWHELDDVGLPAPWTRVQAPVLAIWGEADYPASRSDHVLLAETVNGAGHTTAKFVEMENIGHGFDTAASMRSSMVNRMGGPFNPEIIDVTTAWMRTIAAN